MSPVGPEQIGAALLDQLRAIDSKLDVVTERVTRIETQHASLASQVEVTALAQRVALQERQCTVDTERLSKLIDTTDERLRAIELSIAQHREHEGERPRAVATVGAVAGSSGVLVGALVEYVIRLAM